MAVSKQADIQEMLQRNHEFLADSLQDLKFAPVMALMKKVKGDTRWKDARNMVKYYGVEIVPEGVSGPITEAAPQFHAPEAGDAMELEMSPVIMSGTLGFSGKQKMQLDSMDTAHAQLRIAKRLTRFAQRERYKMSRYAVGSGTTFVAAATCAFLPTKGDVLTAYQANGGTSANNDERLKAEADTGTGYIGSTNVKVRNIKPETNEIELSLGSTWTDDVVLVNAKGSTEDFPMGLQNHLDNVSDTDFMWDTEDGTTCDHDDVYLGGTRSSVVELECQTYNADGALMDLDEVSNMIARCEAQDPSVIQRMVMLYNPKMRRKLVESFQGGARFESKKVHLVGGDLTLPVIVGAGSGDLPTIADYGIPNGKAVILDTGKGRQFKVGGKWLNNGQLAMLPQASVALHQWEYAAYYLYAWNSGWFFPCTSCVGYGFDDN